MKMKVFLDMTRHWWEFMDGCFGGSRYHHPWVAQEEYSFYELPINTATYLRLALL